MKLDAIDLGIAPGTLHHNHDPDLTRGSSVAILTDRTMRAYEIGPVDPTLVRWQTATLPDGVRVLRPVFKPSSGEARPFSLNQFCFNGSTPP